MRLKLELDASLEETRRNPDVQKVICVLAFFFLLKFIFAFCRFTSLPQSGQGRVDDASEIRVRCKS